MTGDPVAWPPCGCHFGPRCPAHDGGPGVFDVLQVTGRRPTDPQPSTVVLSDADLERIARRVAELLRGEP